MHTLILQAVQSLQTNVPARPTSIRRSVRLTPENSRRKRVYSSISLGRALYNMREYMDVGKGYGGIFSYSPTGGRGSGYGDPYYGLKPKPKRKKPKKPVRRITQPKRNPKMNRRRKSTYRGRSDRPRFNRPIRGRRYQILGA